MSQQLRPLGLLLLGSHVRPFLHRTAAAASSVHAGRVVHICTSTQRVSEGLARRMQSSKRCPSVKLTFCFDASHATEKY